MPEPPCGARPPFPALPLSVEGPRVKSPSYGHSNPCQSQPKANPPSPGKKVENSPQEVSSGSFSPKQSGADHHLPK